MILETIFIWTGFIFLTLLLSAGMIVIIAVIWDKTYRFNKIWFLTTRFALDRPNEFIEWKREYEKSLRKK